MRNIYILGAAGSIGLQTLTVLKENREHYHLVGLSLGSNHKTNFEILENFSVEIVCLRDETMILSYQKDYPDTSFVYGEQGLIEVATYHKPGILVNALSGSSGLKPTIAAIKTNKDIALANKETLVMAGDIVKKLVKEYHVNLYPIDSEHSALWQAMNGEDKSFIKKLVITASGGSFRDLNRKQLENVTVKDALKHPNWAMGDKITIDSATMMNKGLEVIEAHHLFDLEYDQIETILHQESIVHGLVYFIDGLVKASLSVSDMKIPITYALFHPNRRAYEHNLELTNLSFKPMDFNRFPLLQVAYDVGKQGGIMPTVMNAANEAAVKLFLIGKISFLDIESIVIETVKSYVQIEHPSLEEIIKTDQEVQEMIRITYGKR
ncbi:MAG: 1-deoxy-D-xylulose-5-phosphate reductoisomerase [Acholeplasmataceae bacterium]|nr:1-deoxy-D-xylulose-5-phosphate reductoisomerase [Acholeplasmataceae bacterium]